MFLCCLARSMHVLGQLTSAIAAFGEGVQRALGDTPLDQVPKRPGCAGCHGAGRANAVTENATLPSSRCY